MHRILHETGSSRRIRGPRPLGGCAPAPPAPRRPLSPHVPLPQLVIMGAEAVDAIRPFRGRTAGGRPDINMQIGKLKLCKSISRSYDNR